MSGHYDRQGNPMSLIEWAKSFEDTASRRVAETTLPNGHWVSTVWLGLDQSFGNGPPLIFETMVFSAKGGDSLDEARYSTEVEAISGHEAMVKKWKSR